MSKSMLSEEIREVLQDELSRYGRMEVFTLPADMLLKI